MGIKAWPMKYYWMKRNDVVTGPYTIDELREKKILISDVFATGIDETIWLTARQIPELNILFSYSQETLSGLFLPYTTSRKPGKFRFRKMFSEDEFMISFRNFLDRIQTARIAALFVIMLTSTFFIKMALDRIVENNFAYMHSAMIQPPVAEAYKAGKSIQNALVKSFVDPAAANRVYLKPAKPKDIMKMIEVKGKSFPPKDLYPTSLIITVTNHSPYLVDNAEVEVSYTAGKKTLIETFQFKGLSPLGSKTMSVPFKKQKARVKYRILNIYTSQSNCLEREV